MGGGALRMSRMRGVAFRGDVDEVRLPTKHLAAQFGQLCLCRLGPRFG